MGSQGDRHGDLLRARTWGGVQAASEGIRTKEGTPRGQWPPRNWRSLQPSHLRKRGPRTITCHGRATAGSVQRSGGGVTDSFAGTSCFRGETTPRAEVSGAASATESHQTTTSPGWTTYKVGQTWKLMQPTRRIGIDGPGMETTSWVCPSSVTYVRFETWWVGIQTNPTRRTSSRSRPYGGCFWMSCGLGSLTQWPLIGLDQRGILIWL